jgi:hypothetical protein
MQEAQLHRLKLATINPGGFFVQKSFVSTSTDITERRVDNVANFNGLKQGREKRKKSRG